MRQIHRTGLQRANQIAEDLRKADEMRAKQARADAEEGHGDLLDKHGETLDKLLKCMDALSTRLDVYDEKEKRRDAEMEHGRQAPQKEVDAESEHPEDPDELALLKTKGEENERGEARHVVANSQSFRDMKAAKMANAQAKCDQVASAFSRSAPRPLDGELIRDYRVRLLGPYKANSDEYAGVPDKILAALPKEVFDIAETKIYADSLTKARNPNVPEGELWPVYETDATGRRMTSWHGEPRTWMQQFSCPTRRVIGIRNRSDR